MREESTGPRGWALLMGVASFPGFSRFLAVSRGFLAVFSRGMRRTLCARPEVPECTFPPIGGAYCAFTSIHRPSHGRAPGRDNVGMPLDPAPAAPTRRA